MCDTLGQTANLGCDTGMDRYYGMGYLGRITTPASDSWDELLLWGVIFGTI